MATQMTYIIVVKRTIMVYIYEVPFLLGVIVGSVILIHSWEGLVVFCTL